MMSEKSSLEVQYYAMPASFERDKNVVFISAGNAYATYPKSAIPATMRIMYREVVNGSDR